MSKKKVSVKPTKRYRNDDQRQNVLRLIKYFLDYTDVDGDPRLLSRETMMRAVDTYFSITDVPATPDTDNYPD